MVSVLTLGQRSTLLNGTIAVIAVGDKRPALDIPAQW
jgi:hypothetical protein